MGGRGLGGLERHAGKLFTVVLLALLVGALALAEAILAAAPEAGLVWSGERPFTPPRELLLREYQPNARFAFAPPAIRRDHSGDRPVRDFYPLETDGDGFIRPAHVHAAPARSLVFLGGSTTETIYVGPENRFPNRAAVLLEAALGLPVNGLNGGRSGNHMLHATLLLIGEVVPLRPDVVVLMEAVNDLGVQASHGGYWTTSRDLGPVRTPRDGVQPRVQRSRDALIPQTWRAVKRATARLSGAAPAAVGGAAGPPPAPPSPAMVEAWANHYEAALRQFVATARAWRILPV